MAARRAWVLNLDADLELEAAPGYSTSSRVKDAMRAHIDRLRASLLSPEDVVVDEHTPAQSARGLEGRAFCPTPCALRLLRHAGALPVPSPDASVLRRANSRAFASSLGPTLPGAEFVTGLAAALTRLREDPEIGEAWRIKRNFGMAGRGQLVVHRLHGATLRPMEHTFLAAGIACGGVQIEPNVMIEHEYALHGMLSQGGVLQKGALVRQQCDSRGSWLGAVLAVDVDAGVRRAIDREIHNVASALTAAGYFGPFCIDAYTYRDVRSVLRLQARSEVNARYSMGFAVGFRGAPGGPWFDVDGAS
jgi:hypothetical protein